MMARISSLPVSGLKSAADRELTLRVKQDTQGVLDFQQPSLEITVKHYARYQAIDGILRAAPEILGLVHQDLKAALVVANEDRRRKRNCEYTADNVLRILVCKTIEGKTFRGIVIRIDDSNFFRRFTRINDGPMMDFSTLNKLANCIRPETWKKVNTALGKHAVENEYIDGEQLRIDTTAVETNIHWPTDSGLLWDTYRVVARLIDRVRELDARVVGEVRLQPRRAKKLHTRIQRIAGRKNPNSEQLKRPYTALIRHVEAVLELGQQVADRLRARLEKFTLEQYYVAGRLAEELERYCPLGVRVVDQARRRILCGEQVANDEKLFSIFEPHTELLRRGKAGKPIEFGHMIALQQVEGCFITDYNVFEKRPNEHQLVEPAVKSHVKLFGQAPRVLTGDKGFYASMPRIAELQEQIDIVAIGKKGGRTAAETARETNVLFRLAQQFRAGIEGSISFLKRCFRLFRCFNKGLVHYTATIGLTVFSHNLLVLARDTS
jgi:IS5 family transposase